MDALKHVTLSKNAFFKIPVDGLPSTLRTLDISDNAVEVDSADLLAIGRKFKRLVHLDVRGNEVESQVQAAKFILARLPDVRLRVDAAARASCSPPDARGDARPKTAAPPAPPRTKADASLDAELRAMLKNRAARRKAIKADH